MQKNFEISVRNPNFEIKEKQTKELKLNWPDINYLKFIENLLKIISRCSTLRKSCRTKIFVVPLKKFAF